MTAYIDPLGNDGCVVYYLCMSNTTHTFTELAGGCQHFGACADSSACPSSLFGDHFHEDLFGIFEPLQELGVIWQTGQKVHGAL